MDDVSYAFEPGKCYAIIGKSGSGKTTLLSLMAGLDLPSAGEILVDGNSTRDWDRNRMRRDMVSVIYQHYNLFPLLTVQENICYLPEMKKLPKGEVAALAQEARERVALSPSGPEKNAYSKSRQTCCVMSADLPAFDVPVRAGIIQWSRARSQQP